MNRKIVLVCPDNRSGHLQVQSVSYSIKAAGYLTEIQALKPSDLFASLLAQSADVAVISADSLPVDLPDELELIATTQREHAHDVVLSNIRNQALSNVDMKIGVSSLLRVALVRHYYPSTTPVLFSTMDELIRVLSSGGVDAGIVSHHEAILNGAGDYITDRIESSYFTPASGQGATAVLCYKKLDYRKKEVIQQWVNHEETEDCIRVERSFLKSLPITANVLPFSYAQYQGALITLKAGAITTNGKDLFKAKRSTPLGESHNLGKKVASEVLQLISGHSVHAF